MLAVIVLVFVASMFIVFTCCRLVTGRLAESGARSDNWSELKQAQRRLMDEVNRAGWHRNREMEMR